ncbi:Cupredoxin [Microthyrium microscopicum]|uniref:Cupredoxin n=1 Tax=Microthyrium microscopicum TaxID=703497 RepID=A0A6A6UMB1_9PEZI|nr:Cupredoxin [Microthyrium microscopicum]
MHLNTVLPLSLSLISGVVAQAAKPAAISINVAGQAAQAPAATQPGVIQATQAPAGGAAQVITIRPQAAGAAPVASAAPALAGQPQNSTPAVGQPGNVAPALAPGAPGSQPVWVVKVGSANNDLVFSPNTLTAKPGDFVQFQFYSRNHSVASSTFETPCQPEVNTAGRAFFSGFMPTEAQGQITYTVPVRDTQPMWFYCPQGRHCQDGMVGVINPPTGQTVDTYKAAAAKAANNVVPSGGVTPQQPGVPGTPAGAPGQIGSTATAPAIAQTTRSAATVVKKATWEMVGAGLIAWFLL